MSVAQSPPSVSESGLGNRWVILLFSVISMVAVANFQYGWTLFVPPLVKALGVSRAEVQVTFTVFVLLETWLVPFEGWLVDKFGPRLLVMVGGVLAGLGWVGSGMAHSLTALYLSYALSGIGAGIVYGTAVGNALKWFPDHRGLAAGLTAAGFGAGAALTVIPIRHAILNQGYEAAFLWAGLAQGGAVLLLSQLLRAPKTGETPAPRPRIWQSLKEYTPSEMVRTPVFWILYFMFVMVAASGLMATAQ